MRSLIAAALVAVMPSMAMAHFKTEPGMPVHITDDQHLEYGIYDNGDRVPDYSWCGYRQSEVPIPWVEASVSVAAPTDGSDATALIQQAIDYVSLLPMKSDGFRGAVVLGEGEFHVEGQLLIRESGVVLRGNVGTVVIAEGYRKDELVRVMGSEDGVQGEPWAVNDVYVPVGATFIPMRSEALAPGIHTAKGQQPTLSVGQLVKVIRSCTAEWLAALGTDKIGHQQEYNFSRWTPGQYEQQMERRIVEVRPDGIVVDAPLTISLDPRYGGGRVQTIVPNGRICNVGVEQIEFCSTYDATNAKDENHRWQAVTMNHVEDGWVRRVTARHFAGSAVLLMEGARRITVEDCRYLEPVSEIANHRRYAFHTSGQMTLFQRCYSERGYHSFAVGRGVPGPNAFVQCLDEHPYSFSGATGGMSSGILFDRCTLSGGSLNYDYCDIADKGSAWTACNSMCWATRASQTHIETPPDAHNWGYGLWTQPFGGGYYQCSHTFVRPESLFYAQLAARTDSCDQSRLEDGNIYRYWTDETTRIETDYAHLMNEVQRNDDMRMDWWSDTIAQRHPLSEILANVPDIRNVKMPKQWIKEQQMRAEAEAHRAPALMVADGILVRGGAYLNNGTRPNGRVPQTGGWRGTGTLTQFYPGHYGMGYTMEPDSLAQQLAHSGAHTMAHHMALWYDCRRNDHERNQHADADAWAPFNESPWSRTGIGEAQDRMSLYDLGSFNPWYFSRLRQFVEAADREGLVLEHEHYFQHNIIEEGAHWCDYPWRGANNINNGAIRFPERQQFAGDKRVYMAEAFYSIDTNRAVRRYHEMFIRRSVDEFSGLNGVIHSLGCEYTGPLHFTRFWLETVNSCPEHQLVSLIGTKDVTDAVLSDPKLAAMVDIIDIRHWHYRTDGTLYSPEGGKSLAPRQWARIIEAGQTDCKSVYHAVREYRDRYPEKVVTYNVGTARPSREEAVAAHWMVLLAGGSLAQVPPCDAVPGLWQKVAQMKPIDTPSAKDFAPVMGKAGVGYLTYLFGPLLQLDLTADKGRYTLYWVEARSGELVGAPQKVRGGSKLELMAPQEGVVAILL